MSKSTDKTESASLPEGNPKTGRRRLLQGGLAAAPVLMTLVSRPVLAQQCTTPSAFVSGNASTPAGAGVACLGTTPGYWKNSMHFNDWRPPYYPTTVAAVGGVGGHNATLFDSVFTPHYSGKTLLQVLELGGGGANAVARHIVAALLNVARGWAPVLTVQLVGAMWGDYITTGYFSPSSGVQWNGDQLVAYLGTTMPM